MKNNGIMSYYLKKNWRSVSLACLFGLLAQAVYALEQLLMMQQFQAAFRLDLQGFLCWTAACAAGYGMYLGLSAIACALEAGSKRKLNNQVRHDLYLSLLSKNHGEYQSQDNGEYLSWLSNNVKQIHALAWTPFFESVNQLALIVSCTAALISLNWVLLAAGLICGAVMMVLPNLFTKKMEQLGAECAEAEARGISKIKDLLSGFEVLRFFGRTDRFIQKGDVASDEMEAPSCHREVMQNAIGCGTGFVSILLQLAQMTVTVVLAVEGKIAVGAIASASNLTAGITNGIQAIVGHRMSIVSAKPYFENITTHDKPVEHGPMEEIADTITIEDLSFSYADKPVLKNVSFRFHKGGKYALTGPSGCGKSTLLKLLLGWLPDYSGAIRFDGTDARTYSPEQIQQKMSCIEQNVFLFNTTIRENITLGQEVSEEQMHRAIRDSALLVDLANLPDGLDTIVGEEGSCLSGGQKQRVAIARALIHDRSILLVDEGTSALDRENADIVEKSLLDNPNLTLILVSHHLTEERRKQFTKVFSLTPVA